MFPTFLLDSVCSFWFEPMLRNHISPLVNGLAAHSKYPFRRTNDCAKRHLRQGHPEPKLRHYHRSDVIVDNEPPRQSVKWPSIVAKMWDVVSARRFRGSATEMTRFWCGWSAVVLAVATLL